MEAQCFSRSAALATVQLLCRNGKLHTGDEPAVFVHVWRRGATQNIVLWRLYTKLQTNTLIFAI